ncbi:Holliday junction branch migration protein RuvA [Bombilactobacillus folatiphilus]|uniref:Holliday junction branch migration complex subunit RuvA n=1 Tax=Bombilactobacillus folatiphilus TaxID=2923362 RepID=A0ABY4P9U8_9LACO|nr:Holliday junction branch migration protein RuvA [Bombilactobacillus folatiphilus]UQS82448.1 Holliday junction branch migration protein RuvA [Bombilactobacillus folatiphilus]
MFEYFQGIVTFVHPTYVVIEVGHVGYRVLVANPYRYQVQQKTTLYIEQVVRDNAQLLYGFYDLAEKELFLQLTSVSGIGPKSALAILADDDHSGLIQAIVDNDSQFLVKFPGVGKKTAQQIILDLKDKLPFKNYAPQQAPDLFTSVVETTTTPALADGLAALAALGYKDKEIQKIQPQLKSMSLKNAGEYVREGLKLLR